MLSLILLSVACLVIGTGRPAGATRAGAHTPAPTAVTTPTDSTAFILLWPNGAPGALDTTDADRPSLTVFRPETPNPSATGVIVLPGGAYGGLSVTSEGTNVARWLNTIGVTAFVLHYRLGPRYHHPFPFDDAQRAIRLVRARAAAFGVIPNHIGLLGFSAGGHLAATAATRFDVGRSAATDPIDRLNSQPNFVALIYPVVSFQRDIAGPEPLHAYAGSGLNLLGPNATAAQLADLSAELHVTPLTPPTFIVHGTADRLVSVDNSIALYRALVHAGVVAELHTFADEGHGGGLSVTQPGMRVWPELFRRWLEARGFLSSEIQ